MLGNLMQSLDASIANVSLPYMQGTLSTSADEITWVLTSYVIAAAIMTAPVGWMAVRFGRKNLHITCMTGFVLASMLCGAADTLTQMVCFRFIQGICGAALVPLSQATMLDIYPFERRAQAMAIFGMGVMVGPITGPTLGGYLTETYNWRYVFYVNLPFGILAMTGLLIFLPKALPRTELKLRLDRLRRCWRSASVHCNSCWIAARKWTGSPPARSSSRRCSPASGLSVHHAHVHREAAVPAAGFVPGPQLRLPA
jgi:DHA2 family multidrug resistance protein